MQFIVPLAIAIGTAAFANSKGYSPIAWFLAGGLLGLITLAILPNLNTTTLPPEEVSKKRTTGNMIGGGISLLAIVLVVFILMSAS
jgi:hypothetical protein